MPSDICLLLLNPLKCHHVRIPPKRSYLHVGGGMDVFLKDFRIKTRVLSLSTCPDWRKVRVGSKEVDEIPTEWEMEQFALEKLKMRRQQSLAQRHAEILRLREELIETGESVEDLDCMTPIANGTSHNYSSSLKFYRTNKSHSLSLQNLVEFGQMDAAHVTYTKRFHNSQEKIGEIQKTKKLNQLKQEMQDFKAFQLQRKEEEEGCGRIRESSLSLAQSENDKEIGHRLQKIRERELHLVKRQNLILEYNLKQKE